MERSARRWFLVGAAVCGFLAVSELSVGIYIIEHTPQVHEVAIATRNGSQTIESKAGFLLAPAAYQVVLFLSILCPLIRWKYLVRTMMEKASPNDVWTAPVIIWGGPMVKGQWSFPTAIKATTVFLCMASGMNLYWAIERAHYVLSKP